VTDYQGLTIKFEGDATDLLNTLRAIDGKATSTQSGLKRINEAMKLNPKDTRLYTERSRMLTKEIGYQEKALSKVKGEYREVSNLQREMQAQLRAMDPSDAGYDQLAADIEYCNEWMKDLDGELAVQESKLGALRQAQRDAAMAAELHGSKIGQAALNMREFSDSVGTIGDSLVNVGQKLSVISAAIAVGFGSSVIRNTEEYGNAISQVGGYLDLTGQKLQEMSDLALYWGKETQFSATEAAQAMSELAKGGMTDAQIKGGALEATMQLAAAGGISMADAATVAVNAIKVFGLSSEDATDVADALAGAANKSTAEIGGLASAFRYVSGWSGLADYSINDVAGALGLLADHGLQAEMAGTGLRNFMQRLGAPTGKAKELLDQYGVSVYDTSGKMKSLSELVNELNRAFGDLDDEARNETLNTIFGARALPAAIALMTAGSEELGRYIEATERAGYAEEMMQARMGDLGWALEYLRGEAETASVNLGEALTPKIIGVANAVEDLLSDFNSLSDAERSGVADVLLAIVGAGPGLLAVGGALKAISGATRGLSTIMMFSRYLSAAAKTATGTEGALETLGQAIHATTEGAVSAERATSLLTAGLTVLAGAAIAFVGIKVAEGLYNVYRHGRETNRMLERSSTLFRDVGREADVSSGDIDNFADELYGVRDSASEAADDIWELIDRVNSFYDSIEETNSELDTNSQRFDEAARLIAEFGGNSEISEEDQRNLAAALQFLNDQLGTNYGLHKDTGGVIYDENGQVVTLKDSIYDLIEAQKELAKVNADTSLLEEGYKDQAEAAAKTKEAEEKLAQAEADRDEALARYGGRRNAQYYRERSYRDQQINGADGYKAQLEAAQAAEEATTQTVAQLEQQLGKASIAAEEASRRTVNAVNDLGDTVPGLRNKLAEAGVSVSDFTGITEDEFNKMVEESGGDLDVLLQKLQEWIDKHPDEKKFPTEAEEAAQKVAELEEQVSSYSRKLQEERANLSTPIRGAIELETDTDGNGTLSEALNTMGRIRDLRGLGKHAGTAQVSGTIWEFMEKLLPGWKQTNLGSKTGSANVSGNLHQSTNDLKEWNRLGMDSKWGKATIALAIQSKGIKQRDGGINYYRHADGYITNHSIYSTGHLIGEAGIEAVLPLNNRAATRPLTDTIADGVARRVAGATQYNLYINDARVNDDPAIKSAFIGLMTTLERKGAMNVGNH